MGVDVPTLGPHCEIWLEHWHGSFIKQVLHKAAEADPKMFVNKPPRMIDRPMTAFEKQGRFGLIDGRHRANKWQHSDKWHPVLVVCAE